jgi:hypothetical protein
VGFGVWWWIRLSGLDGHSVADARFIVAVERS